MCSLSFALLPSKSKKKCLLFLNSSSAGPNPHLKWLSKELKASQRSPAWLFSLTQQPEKSMKPAAARFKSKDANAQSEENLSECHVRPVHSQRGLLWSSLCFWIPKLQWKDPGTSESVINLRISLCAQMGSVSHLYTFREETFFCSAVFHFKRNQSPSVHLEVQTTLRLPSTLGRSSQNYAVSTARFSVTPGQWGTVNLFQSPQLMPDSIILNNWC